MTSYLLYDFKKDLVVLMCNKFLSTCFPDQDLEFRQNVDSNGVPNKSGDDAKLHTVALVDHNSMAKWLIVEKDVPAELYAKLTRLIADYAKEKKYA